MILIAQLHHKDMHAVLLAIESQLRIDQRVRGYFPETRHPPLDRLQRWRMEHELLRALVEVRRGVQAADVAAMAKLGLGVDTDHLRA